MEPVIEKTLVTQGESKPVTTQNNNNNDDAAIEGHHDQGMIDLCSDELSISRDQDLKRPDIQHANSDDDSADDVYKEQHHSF